MVISFRYKTTTGTFWLVLAGLLARAVSTQAGGVVRTSSDPVSKGLTLISAGRCAPAWLSNLLLTLTCGQPSRPP